MTAEPSQPDASVRGPGGPDRSASRHAEVVTFDRLSVSGAAATFALMGAIAAVYGPLLATISHRYRVTLPVAGLTLTVHFVGALVGVVSAMYLVRRIQGRHLLASSLLSMCAGGVIVATVDSWPLFLLGVAVVGLGFGGLDFGLNHLLARTKAAGRASRLSVVNAAYGVGAVAGPLLVDWLTAERYTDLFGGFAVVAAVLSVFSRGLSAPPTARRASEPLGSKATVGSATVGAATDGAATVGASAPSGRAAPSGIARLLGVDRRALLGIFFLAYVLYVSAETSTSGWLASQLHASGYSVAVGSLVTAGFWGGMAIGRVVAAPLHLKVTEQSFVLCGLAISTALALAASSAKVALVVYPVDGLALAAVFPMGLAWYTQLEPRSANGISFLLLGTMAGGVVGPGLESIAVSAFGIRAVPFVLAALTFADLVAFAAAAVVTSHHAMPRRHTREADGGRVEGGTQDR